jgi:hypothetical protein
MTKKLMQPLYLLPFAVVIRGIGKPLAFAQFDMLRIINAHVEGIFSDFHVFSIVRRSLTWLELRLLAHCHHLLFIGIV